MRIIKYDPKDLNWLENKFLNFSVDIFTVRGNAAWIRVDYHFSDMKSKTISRKIDKNYRFKFNNNIFDLSQCPSTVQEVNAYFERKKCQK